MSHPEPETLAAYHAGELAADEERRLQDHLVECAECSALLLDLDALSDPGFGAGALSPAESEALWGRIEGEIRRGAPVVPLRRPAGRQPRWLSLAAAALLAVCLGLGAQVMLLRGRIAELTRPQAGAPVVSLYSSATRSEGSAGQAGVVPAGPQPFTLILDPPSGRSTGRYRAEIVRSGRSGRVWAGTLELNSFGSLSLLLHRQQIGPGDYRLRLFGEAGPREEPIEEYAFRVLGP